jgi:hypothetical protein
MAILEPDPAFKAAYGSLRRTPSAKTSLIGCADDPATLAT